MFDPSDNNIPKKRGRPIGSLNRSTIEKQLAKFSDNDSRPESRSSGIIIKEQGGVCSVCHLQNKKGPNDRMVACRECSNKGRYTLNKLISNWKTSFSNILAHFSCLNGDDMMLRMYPDNTWQCPHCKTCVYCYETSDAVSEFKMLVYLFSNHLTLLAKHKEKKKINKNSLKISA